MNNLSIFIVVASFVLSGCASVPNKGVVGLDHVVGENKEITIVRDKLTRKSVHPILEEWFSENNYVFNTIKSRDDAKASDNVFIYRVWFGWDLKVYMRRVEMEVYKKGNSIGFVEFNALQYGAFGKFGDTTARLKTIMDVLFNKISKEQADIRLGEE